MIYLPCGLNQTLKYFKLKSLFSPSSLSCSVPPLPFLPSLSLPPTSHIHLLSSFPSSRPTLPDDDLHAVEVVGCLSRPALLFFACVCLLVCVFSRHCVSSHLCPDCSSLLPSTTLWQIVVKPQCCCIRCPVMSVSRYLQVFKVFSRLISMCP